MNGLLGKRFIFATIMGICASIVTVLLKFDALTYYKILTTLSGIFVAGQTYSDIKETQNGAPK